jgi:hypothetical protein
MKITVSSAQNQFCELYFDKMDCGYLSPTNMYVGEEAFVGVDFERIPDTVLFYISGSSTYVIENYQCLITADTIGVIDITALVVYGQDTVVLEHSFTAHIKNQLYFSLKPIYTENHLKILKVKIANEFGIDVTENYIICISEYDLLDKEGIFIDHIIAGAIIDLEFCEKILNITITNGYKVKMVGLKYIEKDFYHAQPNELNHDFIIANY